MGWTPDSVLRICGITLCAVTSSVMKKRSVMIWLLVDPSFTALIVVNFLLLIVLENVRDSVYTFFVGPMRFLNNLMRRLGNGGL